MCTARWRDQGERQQRWLATDIGWLGTVATTLRSQPQLCWPVASRNFSSTVASRLGRLHDSVDRQLAQFEKFRVATSLRVASSVSCFLCQLFLTAARPKGRHVDRGVTLGDQVG